MNTAKKWVLATFILTFLVILAGGVVRTTHSGMGCPDWPRCFGKWIPPTSADELPADFEKYLSKQDIDHSFNAFHTWIEYTNRLLGALLGVFALIQTFLLFRKRSSEKKGYRLSIAFLALVILTGLFGALVVKLNLAHYSVSVHLLFAILLTQVQLALLLHTRSGLSTIEIPASWKGFLWLLLGAIVLQSVLGTGVRIFIDDIAASLNYNAREKWLATEPILFILHRSFSWLVLIIALAAAYRCRNTGLSKTAYLLLAIIITSVVTGITLFYADMPAFAQPIHLILAAGAITAATAILLKAKWIKSA